MSGSKDACCAKHGSVPTVFGKMRTQNLTVVRLDPLVCVDRYVVSLVDGCLEFDRALGAIQQVKNRGISVKANAPIEGKMFW